MKKEDYFELLNQRQMMNEDNYRYFHLFQFQKGECLLHQGQRLEYLYILVKGKIKTCHTTLNGTNLLIAFSQAIALLGEVEFINHEDIFNDVYALEDVICLGISISQFEDILLNDILFMQYLAKNLSIKLYNSNQNISISMNYPVENRLASYLMTCHNDFLIEDNFVQVSEMIGCSYRQLQRTLHSFVECGYIRKRKRGVFEILNYSALQKLGKDLYYL